MLPRFFTLVLISFSFVFVTKAQDSRSFIPLPKKNSAGEQFTKQITTVNQKKEEHKNDTTFCSCFVSPEIVPVAKSGNVRTYQGVPNASCSPISTTPSSPDFAMHTPYDTCGVSNVTYSWSITSGNSIATINGSTTNSTVDVSVNGAGSYVVSLTNTVVCSNGSSCSSSTSYTDTVQSDALHCTCTAGPVTIQPGNKQGNLWTYSGNVQGNCTGQYGVPPNTSSCQVQNTTYQWSIDAPGGVASLSGPTNGQTVNVSITGTGPFTLRLDGTTTCSDGQQCTNYNFYFDKAQPTTPQSCTCNVQGANILSTNKTQQVFTYQANVNAQCTGQYGSSPDLLPCNVQNITYNWFISAGASVAEISGNANGQTVNVLIKAPGKFTLDVSGDVTCADGKKCSYITYIDDSSSNEKKCNISFEEKVEPMMNGGLRERYVVTKKIERDGFIILGADGRDYDQVKFTCTSSSDCNESGSNKTILLNSRVRFEWEIAGDNQGSFVKLGGLPKNLTKTGGDNVIFQPPVVDLPVVNSDTTVTTTVKLTIIDDNPTQILDPNVEKTITITTKRSKSSPDEYTVEVKGEVFKPSVPTAAGAQAGDCNAVYPPWEQKTDLKKPEIELPDVPDKDKMVVGEWIVLNAKDQRDIDQLTMKCVSSKCDSSDQPKMYEDNVSWEWTVIGGDGKIISDPTGRFVVYEAPDKLPKGKDVIEVKVRVKVQNPDALKAVDVVPAQGEITLKIYRAGIKLDYPALNWLPGENTPVDVKSFLVYKDSGEWKPALAHQFRIHYFELFNVSTEKGVCMNDPVPADANKCYDLFFQNNIVQEAYNDKKADACNHLERARTIKPEREYSVTVRSNDFGAYGFMRAEASKNKTPEYESIPVVAADFRHPSRPAVVKTEYKDNRINIPRDIDENQIADNGWDAEGGVHVPDPADKTDDADNDPIGDGFKGDGLSNYEEYRGFKINVNGVATHIRTNPGVKDLFVQNQDRLPLNLFRQTSHLSVHEITVLQYTGNTGNNGRIVNFNADNNSKTHIVDQKGLYLFDGGNHASLLGIANGAGGEPAPPNWVASVIVYQAAITKWCVAHHIDFNTKLAQVTAHELAHGCNVYHHGEGDPDKPGTFNMQNGLRSGNLECIMRYDNVDVGHQEAVGSIFCTSTDGTGPFGNANTTLCRGNCIQQFRVSGKGNSYPKRVTKNDCKKN